MAKKRKIDRHEAAGGLQGLNAATTESSYMAGEGRPPAWVDGISQKKVVLQLGFVTLLAFLVYSNTLGHGFVFDDVAQIVNNRWITSFNYISEIFTSDATHTEKLGTSNYYRPMMNLIYLLTYQVFGGLKSWGFHLINVLFHVSDTVLVYIVSSLLMEKAKPASNRSFPSAPLVAAFIFAVHPIHTEVVAWAACVPELSFTFFCLLSLYYNTKSECNFDLRHIVSILFFAVAVLCKETTVTLLPTLILSDLFFRKENTGFNFYLMRYLPYFAVIGIYAVLRFHALGGIAPARYHTDLTTYQVLINTVAIFGEYLFKLVIPTDLHFFYMFHPLHSVFDPYFIFAVVAVLVAVTLLFFKRSKIVILCTALAILPILPVLYIQAFQESVFAERYLYFPSFGFALLVGFILTSDSFNKWKLPVNILLTLLLVFFCVSTVSRNRVWYDELSLWSDTVLHANDSHLVHAQLADAIAEKGDVSGAIQEYQEAIRLNPKSNLLHNSLGSAYASIGDTNHALEEYAKALKIDNNSFEVHTNIGNIYFRSGNYDAALLQYNEALRINPQAYETRNNMGSVYMNKGNYDMAIKEYEEALKVNPNFVDARDNLQMAMTQKTRTLSRGPNIR